MLKGNWGIQKLAVTEVVRRRRGWKDKEMVGGRERKRIWSVIREEGDCFD